DLRNLRLGMGPRITGIGDQRFERPVCDGEITPHRRRSEHGRVLRLRQSDSGVCRVIAGHCAGLESRKWAALRAFCSSGAGGYPVANFATLRVKGPPRCPPEKL